MNPTIYREHCIGIRCPWYHVAQYEADNGRPMIEAICNMDQSLIFAMVDTGQFVEALLLQSPCQFPAVYLATD